jgi:hypothetical protein
MSTREWPSREQWQADAEKSVRQACYPRERVSDQVANWADTDERAQLAHVARQARLGAGRVARLIEQDGTRLDDIQRELYDVHRLLRFWEPVQERAGVAADQAVEEAVAAEIERRKTDEAWERQLRWRDQVDGEWVLPARNAE